MPIEIHLFQWLHCPPPKEARNLCNICKADSISEGCKQALQINEMILSIIKFIVIFTVDETGNLNVARSLSITARITYWPTTKATKKEGRGGDCEIAGKLWSTALFYVLASL